MRKKLCYLLSAILAFGIVAPGGTTTATGLGNSIPAQVLQQGAPADDSDSLSTSQPRAALFDAVTVTVDDEADLLAAIAAATDGDATTIKLTGDIALTGTVTIPAGKVITITNADGAAPTVTGSAKPFVQVAAGGTFTLSGDVTLDGQGRENSFVRTEGSFTLDGATLRNLLASRQGADDQNVGAVIASGGDATFTMASGLITDTTIERDHGAAVYVRDGATATMSGGTITNTTIDNQFAGSVLIDGATFTMEGGEISNGRRRQCHRVHLHDERRHDHELLGPAWRRRLRLRRLRRLPRLLVEGALHDERRHDLQLPGDGPDHGHG